MEVAANFVGSGLFCMELTLNFPYHASNTAPPPTETSKIVINSGTWIHSELKTYFTVYAENR